MTSKDWYTVAAVRSSPLVRRRTMLSQQIEIAKLQCTRSIKERRALENKHATALLSLQNDIDNQMELAKMWQVADSNAPIFFEIQELMAEKRQLTDKFATEQSSLSSKRSCGDNVFEEAFVVTKLSHREPSRPSCSSACWSTSSLEDSTTPLGEANACPVSVAFKGQKPVNDDIQDFLHHHSTIPLSPTTLISNIIP